VRRFRKTAQQTAATNARQISGLGPKERQRLSPGRPALTQLSSLCLGVFVVKWLLCLGGEVGTALLRKSDRSLAQGGTAWGSLPCVFMVRTFSASLWSDPKPIALHAVASPGHTWKPTQGCGSQ
jgi:hypothetical protein